MNQLEGATSYQSVGTITAVESASPQQLVQMLLDGALQRIAIARGHLQRGETARKGEQIGKAISIVEGLRVSLDLDAGEVAHNLADLYDYICVRLLEANVNDDADILTEVGSLLGEIKSAWDALAESV